MPEFESVAAYMPAAVVKVLPVVVKLFWTMAQLGRFALPSQVR